jgi:uncharacterized membrane protein
MKRSFQEILELIAFGLIALVVGTALLWVGGWLLGLVGLLLKGLAGLLWLVLRWILPVAILLGAIYAIVRLFQEQSRKSSSAEPVTVDASTGESTSVQTPAAGSGENSNGGGE